MYENKELLGLLNQNASCQGDNSSCVTSSHGAAPCTNWAPLHRQSGPLML